MIVDAQCNRCRHLDRAVMGRSGWPCCTAFPMVIPVEIQLNRHDHRKPFQGDHGIRFEPIAAFAPLRQTK